MKNLTLTLTTGIAALALMAPGAFAEDADHKDKGEWFKKAAGEDNVMTLEEFTAAKGEKMEADKLQEKFAKMDADSDGKVTEEEFKAAMKHDMKGKKGKKEKMEKEAEAAAE